MFGRMVDVQSATAENRRGKKRKKIETTAAEHNGLLSFKSGLLGPHARFYMKATFSRRRYRYAI